jgi:xyloglucan-specific endo-beta-1,4-glucanase
MKATVVLVILAFAFLLVNPARAYSYLCGQYTSETVGPYSHDQDLWGESSATSGSQCSLVTSFSGTTIAWLTNWTWSGGANDVKSFDNIQLNTNINNQLSDISSIPTTWDWSYSYSGTIVADVAWDLFTSSSSGGSHAYEIMIWLAAYGGTQPIAASYNSAGKAVSVNSFTEKSVTYDLYKGTNSGWTVLSFVPASSTVNSYSGNLMDFINFLVDNDYLPSSQYLTTLQAGTEATSGTAVFTTSSYTVAIDLAK